MVTTTRPGSQPGCTPIDDRAHDALTKMVDALGEREARKRLGVPRETLVRALARRPLRNGSRLTILLGLETASRAEAT